MEKRGKKKDNPFFIQEEKFYVSFVLFNFFIEMELFVNFIFLLRWNYLSFLHVDKLNKQTDTKKNASAFCKLLVEGMRKSREVKVF